jgi:hypothetical protein
MFAYLPPLLAVLLAAADVPAADPPRLIVCGAHEVFIISSKLDEPAEADRTWRWRAGDSPEIPAAMHTQFRTTDECKPAGEHILITASSGGVALVRRQDKRCVFLASAKNAHSACLLPRERVAVASSTGGDELLIFSRASSGPDAQPIARLPLKGAHGALWDNGLSRLWAMGEKELLKVELGEKDDAPQIVVEKRWPLVTDGGHDLAFARDSKSLLITTRFGVYRFEIAGEKFVPLGEAKGADGLAALAEHDSVKSVDEHPTTGAVVYHRATEKQWWSDTIRFAGSERTIRLAGERLYKVRWDVDRGLPK